MRRLILVSVVKKVPSAVGHIGRLFVAHRWWWVLLFPLVDVNDFTRFIVCSRAQWLRPKSQTSVSIFKCSTRKLN